MNYSSWEKDARLIVSVGYDIFCSTHKQITWLVNVLYIFDKVSVTATLKVKHLV